MSHPGGESDSKAFQYSEQGFSTRDDLSNSASPKGMEEAVGEEAGPGLKRDLNSRHINMIAIAGMIVSRINLTRVSVFGDSGKEQ